MATLHVTRETSSPRLTQDMEDLESLSEMGVLFLLFEMGLELSLDRLKVRRKGISAGAWQECMHAAGSIV